MVHRTERRATGRPETKRQARRSPSTRSARPVCAWLKVNSIIVGASGSGCRQGKRTPYARVHQDGDKVCHHGRTAVLFDQYWTCTEVWKAHQQVQERRSRRGGQPCSQLEPRMWTRPHSRWEGASRIGTGACWLDLPPMPNRGSKSLMPSWWRKTRPLIPERIRMAGELRAPA
jgi:hypothetical protein